MILKEFSKKEKHFHKSVFHARIQSSPFLVADTQLYKRPCPSVRWSVRDHESKSGKTSVLEAFRVCVWVGKGVGWGIGCGWGLAAPAHPSATILWPRVTCYSVTTLLLSQWSSDLKYSPCPPARDWGSRVSGLILHQRRFQSYENETLCYTCLLDTDNWCIMQKRDFSRWFARNYLGYSL